MSDAISISLSRGQVDEVVRQAGGEEGIAGALSGLAGRDKLSEAYRSLSNHPQLSRSLLLGLIVLTCFPEDGDTLGVNDVSRMIGLTVSTAFRYVTTLAVAGLLERDPRTRRYRRSGTAADPVDPLQSARAHESGRAVV